MHPIQPEAASLLLVHQAHVGSPFAVRKVLRRNLAEKDQIDFSWRGGFFGVCGGEGRENGDWETRREGVRKAGWGVAKGP